MADRCRQCHAHPLVSVPGSFFLDPALLPSTHCGIILSVAAEGRGLDRGPAYNLGMGPDDKICYCYHVSFRKLYNFARRGNLHKASQMSECLGAGTGCGWCIPVLEQIFESARTSADKELLLHMTPEQYANARRRYIDDQHPRHTFD